MLEKKKEKMVELKTKFKYVSLQYYHGPRLGMLKQNLPEQKDSPQVFGRGGHV